ncbi:MAG: YlxR family protein [Candidatus Dormibacteria bacterium]
MRTCVGCRETHSKWGMIRLCRTGETLDLDPDGRAPGRGAYICAKMECWEAAGRRRALQRALRLPAGVPVPARVAGLVAGMISNSTPETGWGPAKGPEEVLSRS